MFFSLVDLFLPLPSAVDACISQSLVSNFYKLILSWFGATATRHPSSGTCTRSCPTLRFSKLSNANEWADFTNDNYRATHVLDARLKYMTSHRSERDRSLLTQRVPSLSIPTSFCLCERNWFNKFYIEIHRTIFTFGPWKRATNLTCA